MSFSENETICGSYCTTYQNMLYFKTDVKLIKREKNVIQNLNCKKNRIAIFLSKRKNNPVQIIGIRLNILLFTNPYTFSKVAMLK